MADPLPHLPQKSKDKDVLGNGRDRVFRKAIFQQRIALLMARGLTSAERLVGLFMLELVNRKRFDDDLALCCWPKTLTIARPLGCTSRTVRMARAALIDRGALARQAILDRGSGTVWFFSPEWASRVLHDLADKDIDHPWRGLGAGGNVIPLNPEAGGNVIPLNPQKRKSSSAAYIESKSLEYESLERCSNASFSADADDVVTLLLGKMTAHLGSAPVRAWIEPAQPIVAERAIELTAASPASADWIEAHRSDIEASTGLRLVLKRVRR
jgi:hypothetical protein